MCGITGIHVKERHKGKLPLEEMLDYLLVGIMPRGRDATGFVKVDFGGSGVTLNKKDVKATDFLMQRSRPDMTETQTVLGHTRLATQGRPEDNSNNHPVVFGTCFAVHNGHISNDDDVVKEFDLDKNRPAAVDSIAIPIALQSCGMDSMDTIKEGLGKLAGNMAIAAIDPVKHPGRVVLAKGNGSPLWVLHHRTGFYWASTKEAVEFMWGGLIGTPPSRQAKNPSELGWYEFKWGEAWLIEGDEAAPFKFNPAYKARPYYGGETSGYGSWFQGSTGSTVVKNNNFGIRMYTRYTCRPNGSNCTAPCENGCRTMRCLCRETVWNWKGTEYRFDPIEIARADDRDKERECLTPTYCGKKGSCYCYRPVGTAARSSDSGTSGNTDGDSAGTGADAGTEDGPEGLSRCDSCWDWTARDQLSTMQMGTTSVDLCGSCKLEEAVWEAKGSEVSCNVLPDESDADPVIEHYQTVAEAANAAHKAATEKTAVALGCTTDFVEWLLFKATIEDLEAGGETLASLRQCVEDEYEEQYDEGIEVGL